MTKKELKQQEELNMLQRLVVSYNGRMKAHLHEREVLMKEYEWLKKKLDKAFEKAEREENEQD